MIVDLTSVLQSEDKVLQTEVTPRIDTFVSKLGVFPIVECPGFPLKVTKKGKEELQIEGKGEVCAQIPCNRCLEDVSVTIPFEFEKTVKVSKNQLIDAEVEEQDYVDGYNLDVDKLVYGEILLNWPLKTLCKEDCKGICSICGANLNHRTCNCDNTDLDPRMAKIRDIFSKFKEV